MSANHHHRHRVYFWPRFGSARQFLSRETISTAESIALDQVPIFDLIKMAEQIFRGRTWNGYQLDWRGRIIDSVTVILRTISIILTFTSGYELFQAHYLTAGAGGLVILLLKIAALVTYILGQLRQNNHAIKYKYPLLSKVIQRIFFEHSPRA